MRIGESGPRATGAAAPAHALPYRGDVEGLRAVAVLLVVAFHVDVPHLSGGFVGVDVFFAISGYLITGLLTAELARTGTISLPAFFARRIRRLLPAAAVVLCTTLALAALLLPPMDAIRTAAAARASAVYATNIHFLRLASDYFSGDVRSNPTLHTWSLAVEEQFYLVWPIVLLVLARIGGASSSTSSTNTNRRALAWGLTAIGMVSFVAASWFVTTSPSVAFYAAPLRAWEFACGGLASLVVWRRNTHVSDAMWNLGRTAVGWMGFALILGAGIAYSPATEFPGASALLPVVGTSMLLLAGAVQSSPARGSAAAVLSAAPLRWIGRRSYSWYLWHWPALVLGAAVSPNGSFATRAGLAIFSLPLADLTYRFVETPTRAPRGATTRASRAWRTIALGATATILLFTFAEGARRRAVTASHDPLQIAITTAADDRPRVYGDGCIDYAGDERVHVCRYGAANAPAEIVLFGDSHAVQWLSAVEEVARTRGWAVLVIAKTRCATADVAVYVPQTGREAEPCARWRRAAMDTIRARHPAVVVLSNAMCYIESPLLPTGMAAVTVATWERGMRTTLEQLNVDGVPAVVIQDTPQLQEAVLTCLARSGWLARQHGACGSARRYAVSSDVAQVEQRVVAAVSGSHLVDMTNVLCQPNVCTPIVGDRVAYQDGDHLTSTMARTLAPLLAPVLDSVVTGRALARTKS